jgi:hypothetical protein
MVARERGSINAKRDLVLHTSLDCRMVATLPGRAISHDARTRHSRVRIGFVGLSTPAASKLDAWQDARKAVFRPSPGRQESVSPLALDAVGQVTVEPCELSARPLNNCSAAVRLGSAHDGEAAGDLLGCFPRNALSSGYEVPLAQYLTRTTINPVALRTGPRLVPQETKVRRATSIRRCRQDGAVGVSSVRTSYRKGGGCRDMRWTPDGRRLGECRTTQCCSKLGQQTR